MTIKDKISYFKSVFFNEVLYDENDLSLTLYAWMMFSASLTAMLYGLFDLYIGKYVIGIVLLCVAVVTSFCLYLIYRKVKPQIIYQISTFVFFSLFTLLVHNSVDNMERLLWCYTFPIATIFVMGIRYGLIWSIVFLYVVSFEILIVLSFYYSKTFLATFIAVYIVITTIVFWIELYKNKYYEMLKFKNQILKDEIEKKLKLEYKLIAIEQKDILTSLLNQNFFLECVDKEIKIARDYNSKLFMATIDIDDFKKISDEIGTSSDKILQKISKNIQDSIRKDDILGRIDEDEFAIIFTNMDYTEAYNKLDALRRRISLLSFFEYEKDNITVSIGLASFNNSIKTSKEFYNITYKALIEAKKSGKNRVVYNKKHT